MFQPQSAQGPLPPLPAGGWGGGERKTAAQIGLEEGRGHKRQQKREKKHRTITGPEDVDSERLRAVDNGVDADSAVVGRVAPAGWCGLTAAETPSLDIPVGVMAASVAPTAVWEV